MVVCTCGQQAVVKTSWTDRNPGRCFYGCPTYDSKCHFLGWVDASMCRRSVEIILGLLRRINGIGEVVDLFEEQQPKYKKYLIIVWVVCLLYCLTSLDPSTIKSLSGSCC
ncbi:zinc finger, GRF-type [Artemisia annua]|uniref:Zinc finger, GRF-type n=1 Tax=Artemisia annua TaxID=35608 RepID=A0A2U1LH73_ARTAN|nr:zinc finger, GRF-type [Artemisia annua]